MESERLRSNSAATEVASSEDLPTFSLSGPVVQLTDDGGATYLFLRLLTEVAGETYTLPFYRSSGRRSGFAGLWFPCVEVEERGHILKGTPPAVPRFMEAASVMRDESFLERISSRLGLFGMAALNTMSEEEFALFRNLLLRESRGNSGIEGDIIEAVDLAEPLFLTERTDLKEEVADAMAEEKVRVASSREALNRFLAGETNLVGGGSRKKRRMTKRRKVRPLPIITIRQK